MHKKIIVTNKSGGGTTSRIKTANYTITSIQKHEQCSSSLFKYDLTPLLDFKVFKASEKGDNTLEEVAIATNKTVKTQDLWNIINNEVCVVWFMQGGFV